VNGGISLGQFPAADIALTFLIVSEHSRYSLQANRKPGLVCSRSAYNGLILSSLTRQSCNFELIVFLLINQAPVEEPGSDVGRGGLYCAEAMREPGCEPDNERESTLEPR